MSYIRVGGNRVKSTNFKRKENFVPAVMGRAAWRRYYIVLSADWFSHCRLS